MTMILEIGEICPHAHSCPYNEGDPCFGTRHERENVFQCDYVTNGKLLTDGSGFRNPLDQTGKMKVIMG